MKKALIGLVVVGAVLAGLFVLLRAPEGPIVLAYKYKAGDVTTYSIAMETKMADPFGGGLSSSPAQKSQLRMDRSVVNVNRDGSARINVRCRLCSGLYVRPGFPSSVVGLTFARNGRISVSKELAGNEWGVGLPGSTEVPMGLLGFSAVLPSHGVAVGQMWSDTVPFPAGGGNINVTSTLVSDRCRLGKRRVCRIQNRYEGTIDLSEIHRKSGMRRTGSPEYSGEAKIEGEGTVCFSREEGRVIRHDDKVRFASTITIGQARGTGGSSTGASVTYQMVTEAEARAVLVKNGSGPSVIRFP